MMDTHCAVHHGPVALCPPPELADVLTQLRADGIHPRITRPVLELDPCGACAESLDWLPEEAVAIVGHTATDTPKAYRYLETACAACLADTIAWHRKFAVTWWVDIPAHVGQVTV